MADSSADALEPETVNPDPRYQAQKEAASTIYLELDDWQIRLLFLLPGKHGESLVAELHTVDMLHGPGVVLSTGKRRRVEYTALSYCWGPARFEQDVILNGKLYPITRNLFDALQHVRTPVDILPLWVDALCINQHQTDERSMQVANILTIFHKAKKVIGWLGKDGTSTSYAVQRLRENDDFEIEPGSSRSLRATGQGSGEKVAIVNFGSKNSDEKHYEHQLAWSSENDAVQMGIRELLQRDWFRRVWIRQEVFAAQILELQCGRQKVSWRRLARRPELLNFTRRTPSIVQELETGEHQNRHLDDNDAQTDIVNVLNRVVNCEATDPRDFVYGVLGMSRTVLVGSAFEHHFHALLVDYNKHVSEVFRDVALYVMRRDQCLNVLLLHAHFGGTINGCKLPSWIPDWRLPTSPYPWLQHVDFISRDDSAGSPDYAYIDGSIIGNGDNGVLTLNGFILGHVASNDSEPYGDSVWQLADNLRARKFIDDLTYMIFDVDASYGYDPGPGQSLHRSVHSRVNQDLLRQDASENGEMCESQKGPRILINEFHDYASVYSKGFSISLPQDILDVVNSYPEPFPKPNRAKLSVKNDERAVFGENAEPPEQPHARLVNISTHTDMLRGKALSQELCQRIVQPFLHDSRRTTDWRITRECDQSQGWGKDRRRRDDVDGRHLFPLMEVPLQKWKPRYWQVCNGAKIGDAIVFVQGGLLPLVIRPVSRSSQCELVGPAALPEWTFWQPDRSEAWELLDLDQATRDRFHRPGDYYLLWHRLLEIHREDNQLETFHLV